MMLQQEFVSSGAKFQYMEPELHCKQLLASNSRNFGNTHCTLETQTVCWKTKNYKTINIMKNSIFKSYKYYDDFSRSHNFEIDNIKLKVTQLFSTRSSI